jgi:hypothetical protein
MRLRAGILTALMGAGLVIGGTVLAQPKERDHRKKPEEIKKEEKKEDKKGPDVRDHRKQPPPKSDFSVTGFSPQSGKVGTVVTITGTGFVKQDKVLVGGRPVKSGTLSDTQITFAVPARFFDGQIVVRHPGAANDVVVGTFTVIADPVVASFAPTAGPYGTRVEIKGSGFMNGDQVLFNGKALPISELGPERLVVSIPQGATTDFFTVQRPGGVAARSRGKFKVVLPAPSISGIAPTTGGPGTPVRIAGTNFAAEDRAFYGRIEMKIVGRSENYLDVTIPANANRSDNLVVRGPRGQATTSQPFALVLPPVVARFNPISGAAGTRVDIVGAHFMAGDSVWLGRVAMKTIAVEEGKLTVEITAGAQTGPFVINRGGQPVATSKGTFEVVAAPVVTSFAPAGGPPGTKVQIIGQNFSNDARVMYGAQNLRVLGKSPTTIDVVIPGGATDQPFVVQTKGGTAQSARAFQVYNYSTVVGVQPLRGTVGTRVTIKGRAFNGNDLFFLGQASLAIVEKGADFYVVQIPANAQSGPIEWESFGKRTASRFRFEVLQPASVASFTPASGPAGTQVTITGANFTNSTAVFFGLTACAIIRRNLPTQLVVVIPANAAGTDYLWVEEAGQRNRSATTFQVIAPPVLSSFSPASGPVGTQVTINRPNLSASTQVMFGTVVATIVSRAIPTKLVVQVPAGVQGQQFIWLEDRGQKVKSTAAFSVVDTPVITSVAPLSGPAGTSVTITGEKFGKNATVWFGNLQCAITKRVRNTQLTVTIPANATGKAYLIVEDNGVKAQSGQMFEVVNPPDPPPAGDGHHEHAHEHPHKADDHHHHPHAHPHRNGATHHHPY